MDAARRPSTVRSRLGRRGGRDPVDGFYNLFLAVGIIVGIAIGGTAGTTLVVFCCACIVAAAAVLLTTGLSYLRAATTQALFAVIALVLFAVL
ncbi:hypothetical protein GCM10009722_25640 [Williamsia deligens]|nr:Protein of unknown function (DUF1304) [Williamsia deligens]